jgi:glutaredoxin
VRAAGPLLLAITLTSGSLLAATEIARTPTQTQAEQSVVVELYSRAGCPRCLQAKEFLRGLQREQPSLRLVERPIDADASARRELERRLQAAAVKAPGVPTIIVRGHVLVGFDSSHTTGASIRRLLSSPPSLPPTASSAAACSIEPAPFCDAGAEQQVASRWFGPLSVSRLGLPLFTLALGLLDGFNPCAMWVLLFLLGMLAGQRDRKRMAVTAGTFVIASGAVYYAFMAAWLNVFLLIGVSRAVQTVLGGIAIVMAALNLKDFVAFGQGPSLSIPAAAKPSIYARVRRVLRADSLGASILGVAVLAVLVNFVELLCTAGFPAVYTSVLARQQLSPWARALYLGLYNLAYVADDALVVTLAVLTLSRRRMAERTGRWLKLLSGVVMLLLGALLLFKPEWLV